MKSVVLILLAVHLSLSLPGQLNRRIRDMPVQSAQAIQQNQSYYNPAAVSGTIRIEGDISKKLSNPIESARILKAELWQVKFFARHDNPSFNATELENKAGDASGITISAEGSTILVNYSFTNIPANGNFAVVVYCSEIPGGLQPEITSTNPARLIGNNSNITRVITGNIKAWCITPLNKLPHAGQPVSGEDFFVKELPAGVLNTRSVIGDITNLFEEALDGLAAITPDGAESFAGLFINNTGGLFLVLGSSLLDVIAYGNTPRVRTLTDAEYETANDFFSGGLPEKKNIIVTNLMGESRRAFTIPGPGGKIYLSLGDLFDNPVTRARMGEVPGQLFIHEMTHAWQIEHNPDLKAFREGAINQWRYTILGDKSVYAYTCGSRWDQYNFEQQGKITENAYAQVSAGRPGNCERELVEKNIRNGKALPAPSFGKQNDKYNYKAGFSAGYQPTGNNCIPVSGLDARFLLAMMNRVFLITNEGKTLVYDFDGTRLGSSVVAEGPPVAAKADIDQFVLPYGNKLLVVTSSGDVWAHPVNEKREGDIYRKSGSVTVGDATILSGDKLLYTSAPGKDEITGISNKPFRYLTISGNVIYGITERGAVHRFEINGSVISHSSVNGAAVATHANDRFVFALGSFIYVTTASGEVFRHLVTGNKVYEAEKCTGAPVAGNGPIDQFLLPIPVTGGNKIMVVRSDCAVWLQNAPEEMKIN